jgi:hypothetical protein
MAKSAAPSTWLSGYTNQTVSTITITASSLGLSNADIDASTGDIRKIMAAISTKLQQWHDGLATADKMTTFVPTHAANGQTTLYTFSITAAPNTFTIGAVT